MRAHLCVLRLIHHGQSWQFWKAQSFFLHKYVHLGRFSLRSPRPSVLKPVNRRFGTHRGLGELVSILTDNDALRMWCDQSECCSPWRGGGGRGQKRWESGGLCHSTSENKSLLIGVLVKSPLFPSKYRTYGITGVNGFVAITWHE